MSIGTIVSGVCVRIGEKLWLIMLIRQIFISSKLRLCLLNIDQGESGCARHAQIRTLWMLIIVAPIRSERAGTLM